MILIDTSVWVDHLKAGDAALVAILERGEATIHPFIIGELALGSLRNRSEVLGYLRNLPELVLASDDEVQDMIEARKLYAGGIGYVDAHLLASVLLSPGTCLWTRDKRLKRVAGRLALLLDRTE